MCFTAEGTCKQMKLKSAWYIMLRAIREIICRSIQTRKEPSEINAVINKRMESLKCSKDFLPLKDTAINLWRDYILVPFCHWLCFENSFDVDMVRNEFPVHYRNFLLIKKKDDTLEGLYCLVDDGSS